MSEEFFLRKFESLESTQSYAKSLLNSGEAVDGMVISTLNQLSGFGRSKKDWLGLEGNIALTMILKPKVEEVKFSQISFIACISVGETLRYFIPKAEIRYKWVNDVFINNGKVSGVLLEKIKDFLFVGIGVNLKDNQAIRTNNGISLERIGCSVEHEDFEALLLKNFHLIYNSWLEYGFVKIRNMWLENAMNIGKRVLIKTARYTADGVFDAIDESGNAVLITSDGREVINAGEMW